MLKVDFNKNISLIRKKTYEEQVREADNVGRAGTVSRTSAGNRNSGDGKNVGGNRQ